ncbi:MAG TPA: hydroxymethylbilane synthase [Stellaceae bacterium]|jgi:hydroxymethylbilane synthase|nr:hydroxymethylbilane synthase [Stellaceae bacterium]
MASIPPLLRIGTRGSALALAQAHEVQDRLSRAHDPLRAPGAIEIVVIQTTGDRVTDRSLNAIGGKGLFTKEIEEALLDRRIDIAVHSMKDVPTILPAGLVIDCLLPREDARDVLFARKQAIDDQPGGISDLKPGIIVGTASLRRQAQILMHRPDVTVVPFRGNVGTRLAKLESGVVDATLLAAAGLRRLGHDIAAMPMATVLSEDMMLPAVAQGAIGIERRQDDDRIAGYLAALNHVETHICVAAERALLATLDGSCRTPIAAHATLNGNTLTLQALIVRPDGSEHHRATRQGAAVDAVRIGNDAGAELRGHAGPGFFSPNLPEQTAR